MLPWWPDLVPGPRARASSSRSRVAVPTVDFRDGKIRSFRTYFDDISLIEQIAGA
jgi:hypothetical protein